MLFTRPVYLGGNGFGLSLTPLRASLAQPPPQFPMTPLLSSSSHWQIQQSSSPPSAMGESLGQPKPKIGLTEEHRELKGQCQPEPKSGLNVDNQNITLGW
ncbi:hypothetical protein DPEC_G00227210 [Dallia pectoralis]|uniref:Uncharacterized protein n=1 Tax=Dallia pectoralis TaxID=75939 RepID=A0ACC2G0J9_DALPE|nr:hypothetical protein DPEC_G00227210 [Dallia pectoralis]